MNGTNLLSDFNEEHYSEQHCFGSRHATSIQIYNARKDSSVFQWVVCLNSVDKWEAYGCNTLLDAAKLIAPILSVFVTKEEEWRSGTWTTAMSPRASRGMQLCPPRTLLPVRA